jgi:CheY-like chemotaxis protein
MFFAFRHWNRATYPTKHVLICEDDLNNQRNIMAKLAAMYPGDGHVQATLCCGALAAATLLSVPQIKFDLIILDHDLPEGNGSDLLGWLKEENRDIPVITFSGIPANNEHMRTLGAHHIFSKPEVLAGAADDILRSILG